MSFKESVKTCFTKYADFSGRARRSEFWYFELFLFIASIIINTLVGSDGILSYAVYLALLIPSLSVSVRRMHDIGKSGWYLLMSLIPVAGIIIVLVKLCADSVPGENAYGPSPKGDTSGIVSVETGAPAASAPTEEEVDRIIESSYEPQTEPASEPAESDIIIETVQKEMAEKRAPQFCTSCGSPLTAGSKFCTNCGAPVEQ